MSFDDLVGNEAIKKRLQDHIATERIHSTLLFHGREGVGKGLFALNFAKALLGQKKEHPDLRIIEPEGKWHNMATLLEMINEATLPPFEAKWRIFIIRDADRMLPMHINSLLKTLEEPPPYAIFILTTDDIDAIIPTIRSRTLDFPFAPISQKELETHISHERATQIAHLAQGSMGYAKRLMTLMDGDNYNRLVTLIKTGLSERYELFFNSIESLDKDLLAEDIFAFIRQWFRDLYLVQQGADALFFTEEVEDLKLLSQHMSFSLEELERRIVDAIEGYQLNLKLKHCLEGLFWGLQLCSNR
ncbi:MAG: DNA polymerase III subunit [Simkaniaceae bacterium]|nr:DNA polymerase III subunit [Simkaniaceae bacterium]